MVTIRFPRSHPEPSAVLNACPECDEIIRLLLESLYGNVSPTANGEALEQLGFRIDVKSPDLEDPFTITKENCCFTAIITEIDQLITLVDFTCDNHPAEIPTP